MPTQNILLIGAIELIIFYLILYSLLKARIWVRNRQIFIDEISEELPEIIRKLRNELENFNYKITHPSGPKPLSSQELGYITGTILTEILTAKIPKFGIKNHFVIFSIIAKLWKYRDRFKATLLNCLSGPVS